MFVRNKLQNSWVDFIKILHAILQYMELTEMNISEFTVLQGLLLYNKNSKTSEQYWNVTWN